MPMLRWPVLRWPVLRWPVLRWQVLRGVERLSLVGVLAVLLLSCSRGSSSPSSSNPVQSSEGQSSTGLELDTDAAAGSVCTQPKTDQASDIFVLTNEVREENGVEALNYSAQLQQAAQTYAEVLAAGAKLDHVGPAGDTVFDRVKATGYTGRAIGENLAGGQLQAETVVEGWKNSASHKANLFSASFTQVGIGFAEGAGTYGTYWVQVFGDGECE